MTILNLPKHRNPDREERTSSAPYNFVPLPDKVITAVNDPKELPDHDTYDNPSYPHTGYFDVTLTTKSPLYVRGMLTRTEFDLDEQGKDRRGQTVKNGVTRIEDRLKNKPEFFHTGDASKPIIPGSSLRGMLRSLVEIVSYSKFGPMSKSPKITFRAVAAPVDDPLSASYYSVLGRYGRDVFAGYLVKQDKKWKIRPARKPSDLGFSERGAYLKVKDIKSLVTAVPGLKRFNDKDYVPQFHSVSFDTEPRVDRQGRKYTAVTKIGDEQAKHRFIGTLVCSGNMLETGEEGQGSPRVNYSLVLEPDSGKKVELIEISEVALTDYVESLTPFLKETPFDPSLGCLIENKPVFYVEQDGKALCFGHCPNFRVPAFLKNTNQTATPADFLPSTLCQATNVDFADAMFGYVEKKRNDAKQGDKANAYASRVLITDATTTETNVFLPDSPFSPEILATPKPTAFQHYLVQNSDAKRNLKHYGSAPEDTAIRGSKLYWKRGDRTDLRAKPNTPKVDAQGNVDSVSTQHTLIKPVRSDVRFTFRIHFENLSNEELGALCWALYPLGNEQKEYCHQLGMGKSLGMGAVKLGATLHLNKRKDRYESLFDGAGWATGYAGDGLKLAERSDAVKTFTDAFETRIRTELNVVESCSRLAELKRIAMLLKMMEWENGLSPADTQTQDLQTGFKDRRVLPDPSFWISQQERDRLVDPVPTQTTPASGTPQTETGIGSRSQGPNKASQSGMGNTLEITTAPPPVTAPAKAQPAKEQVTLVGQIKAGGKAQVKTEQGEQITCERMPTGGYNVPKSGATVWAKVERNREGKAISARYVQG